MVTSNTKSIAEELEIIEAALATLTIRVGELRNSAASNQPEVRTNTPRSPRSYFTGTPPIPPKIGDLVSLRIIGIGLVQGTIVGVTAQRVKVDVPGRGIITRAPYNVTIL